MNTTDFDYNLPEAAIAQEPAADRDRAKLLILDRRTGGLETGVFRDIESRLTAADLLVLNDTRVVPARLRLTKESGGKVEVFILRETGEGRAEALVRGRVGEGRKLPLGDGVELEIGPRTADGKRAVTFPDGLPVKEALRRFGEVPLPPYIRRPVRPEDREDYQTVYSREEGAVAAPTAGLHFTPELLRLLENRGVSIHYLTLHTGWGTFRTIQETDIEQHKMEAEYFEISPAAAAGVNRARADGRRVVAVGTTCVRTLEGNFRDGRLQPRSGWVNSFIYPGYRFQTVDAFITNFHLPRTTTLLLTAAFAGREALLEAYAFALRHGFRFGSYGDAMMIV